MLVLVGIPVKWGLGSQGLVMHGSNPEQTQVEETQGEALWNKEDYSLVGEQICH